MTLETGASLGLYQNFVTGNCRSIDYIVIFYSFGCVITDIYNAVSLISLTGARCHVTLVS